jgi:hypothetical protein
MLVPRRAGWPTAISPSRTSWTREATTCQTNSTCKTHPRSMSSLMNHGSERRASSRRPQANAVPSGAQKASVALVGWPCRYRTRRPFPRNETLARGTKVPPYPSHCELNVRGREAPPSPTQMTCLGCWRTGNVSQRTPITMRLVEGA